MILSVRHAVKALALIILNKMPSKYSELIKRHLSNLSRRLTVFEKKAQLNVEEDASPNGTVNSGSNMHFHKRMLSQLNSSSKRSPTFLDSPGSPRRTILLGSPVDNNGTPATGLELNISGIRLDRGGLSLMTRIYQMH